MEIKLLASGVGASIPKFGIGASVFNGVYIMLRSSSTGKPYILGIAVRGVIKDMIGKTRQGSALCVAP